MGISKMLTLSTAHVSTNTGAILDSQHYSELIVYEKECSGWFIYLGSESLQINLEKLPSDLRDVIMLALQNDCQWLCLDVAGEELAELPTYDD